MKNKIIFLIALVFMLAVLFCSCDEECRHQNMNEAEKKATCTENGQITHTCLDCGYTYITDIVEPKGHIFTENKVEPECTEDGYTEYTCDCGFSYTSDYVSAVGHQYEDSVKLPTCSDGGYTTHTCTVCEYSYISNHTDPSEHDFEKNKVAPTCTEQGYTVYKCSNCDHSFTSGYTAPLGHKYTAEALSELTCTSHGKVKHTCECGDTYTVTTAPQGHDFSGSSIVTMPTLSDMGYTEFSCKNCDYKYVGDYRFYSDILKNAYADNTEAVAKGIDVSYHQYENDSDGGYIPLDWQAIKNFGIDYAIIRISDTSVGIDPTFEQSYSDAKDAGLDVGFYLYTNATSVDEIRLEANFVLSALKGKKFEYPVYLDLENELIKESEPAIINEMCVEFFTILQRAGYYTGLYLNHEWLYNEIDTESALSRFELWYARYPETTEYAWNTEAYGQPFGMWQYTDNGYIGETKFDFSFAYKDYPTLIKEGGFNGYEGDVKFPDTGKSFVWVVYDNPNTDGKDSINIRSKSDYFTSDDYSAENDIIGYAEYGSRFEVIEQNEKYTAIKYNGGVAYISAKPQYISFTGIYVP